MKMDEYKFFGDCLASGLLRITRFVGAILFIFFLLLGIVQAKSGNFENQIAYGGKGVSVKLLDDQEISGELLSVDDSILYLGAGTSFNDLAWRVNLNEVRIIELLEKDNILKGLKIGVGSGCVLSGIILIMSLSEGANNPLDLIVFPIGAAILVGILVGGGSLIGTTVGYLSSSKETEYYLLSDSEKYTFIKRLELLCKYIYLPSDYLIKDFRIRPGVITTETKHQYSNDENWQPSEKYSVGSVATTKSGKKKNPRHFALSLGYERNWALFSIRDEAYDYVVSAGFGDSRPLPDFPHSVEYHHGDQDYNHLSLSCEYVTSKRFTFGLCFRSPTFGKIRGYNERDEGDPGYHMDMKYKIYTSHLYFLYDLKNSHETPNISRFYMKIGWGICLNYVNTSRQIFVIDQDYGEVVKSEQYPWGSIFVLEVKYCFFDFLAVEGNLYYQLVSSFTLEDYTCELGYNSFYVPEEDFGLSQPGVRIGLSINL